MARFFRRGGRFKRRKFGGRRRFGGRRSIKRVARRVRRLENAIETKEFGAFVNGANAYLFNNTTFVAGTQLSLLNAAMVQGNTDSTRIGSKINLKSLEIRWMLEAEENAAAFKNQTIRLMLFIHKIPNKLAPVLSDLLQQSSYTAPTPADFLAQRTWETRRNFRMIRDKFITLTGGQQNDGTQNPTFGVGKRLVVFKWHIKLKNLEVQFAPGAGTGTFADIIKNGLWLAWSSVVPIAGGLGPFVTSTFRLKYIDA